MTEDERVMQFLLAGIAAFLTWAIAGRKESEGGSSGIVPAIAAFVLVALVFEVM